MENPDEIFNEFLRNNISKEEAEKKEADELIHRGFYFDIGKRKWEIKPLVFGTISHANKYALDLKINLLSDDNSSVFKEIEKNIKPLMSFIAVCILHHKWKIKLFTRILSVYLKWKLDPSKALKICVAILQMYDIKNFTTSISLIGQMTITKPNPKSPKETSLVDGKTQVSSLSSEP
ncbi:hypothetical protein [Chryseobacterium defluvii]|nr:hypothetical protein [Chryseobacterium defluvii]